jgi:proteic killer suppression protein
MDVRHDDGDLERLETDEDFNAGLGKPLVRAFRKTLNIVRRVSAASELRNWRGLHFEKLKGDRSHQHSLRLNDQWRLVVELESTQNGEQIVVKEIVDYH